MRKRNPFDNGRVRVVAGVLAGRCGAVTRRLHSTPLEAWVRMDDPIPSELRCFPDDDPRRDHILLRVDEVEAVGDSDAA